MYKLLKKSSKKTMLKQQLSDDKIPGSEINPDLVTGYQGIYNTRIKRIIDLVLALIIFICILPIYLIVSIVIVIEDGFPILYCAERGGYHGGKFKICKFRSMVKNADQIGGGTTALHDNRITKIGKIIRKIKVDEFPNLLNVIKGDMSFIGPRPELLRYTNEYKGTEKLILEVRPGMTDYSSIEFINLDEIVGSGNADEMYEKIVLPEKNKLRIKYAAMVSFSTDMKLFILTVLKVLEKVFNFMVKKEHR